MSNPNLKQRAVDLYEVTNLLSDGLSDLGLSEPSFEHGLPALLHADAPESNVGNAKQKLLQMLDEFRALLTEPTLLLTPELASPYEQNKLKIYLLTMLIQCNPLISVHSIVRLGIAENFPSEGTTVQAIAKKLNLRESLVRRLLAHCATHHIYFQTSPDSFMHTAASKVLADNDGMRKWILIGAEELIPATLKVCTASSSGTKSGLKIF